jgi:ATP-dependent Lhr-like helicase
VVAVNAGTIPDRGLYGVYLAGADAGAGSRGRLGELDEEMVLETRVGEAFVLGASSWRVEEITHDRVLVSPAPGAPGKMPFWRGDGPGRPLAFGERIGRLARGLVEGTERERRRLLAGCGLDPRAAKNLLAYVNEQAEATGEVPSDRCVVIERLPEELGDARVCLLSPFGARVHAPWALAIEARLGAERGNGLDLLWSDDGIVLRLPELAGLPDAAQLCPDPDEVEDLLASALGSSSLFAARFRENAARALLLPRRHPGRRSPLWAQRKRAAELLAAVEGHGSFPIVLETWRECLQDTFDLPGLKGLLRRIRAGDLRVRTVDRLVPSPFANGVLFGYVGNFLYEGDAPLAERRAQALSVDPARLRELLGEPALRELLDPDAILEEERRLQRLGKGRPLRDPDELHELLLRLGHLTPEELGERGLPAEQAKGWLRLLEKEQRALRIRVAGRAVTIAAEDAARYRDGLGCALSAKVGAALPASLRGPVADPLGDLVSRYARTHGPFPIGELSAGLGCPAAALLPALGGLARTGRLLEGEFLPPAILAQRGLQPGREWVDAEVLRRLRGASAARLRKQIEPVAQAALARALLRWQGVGEAVPAAVPHRARAAGPPDRTPSLAASLSRLAGAPLVASALGDLLAARTGATCEAELDRLLASGALGWRGLSPIGEADGRILLGDPEQLAALAPPCVPAEGELEARMRTALAKRGASFFHELLAEVGGFAAEALRALWALVFAGEVANDTLQPLRRRLEAAGGAGPASRTARRLAANHNPWGVVPGARRPLAPSQARRELLPGSEGRWSLVARSVATPPDEATRRLALARTLLARHGLVSREVVEAEGTPGGFGAVYPALRALEEAGEARRGLFVDGLGAAQFALPAFVELLRAQREGAAGSASAGQTVLAATDPANPYGAILPWPPHPTAHPQRAAGALVLLDDGALRGYLGRGERSLATWLPEREPERSAAARALARGLAEWVRGGARRSLLLAEVDGGHPLGSVNEASFIDAGFASGQRGLWLRP